MIGDTVDEMNAFYIGLLVGCYIGFKLAFVIWVLKKKMKKDLQKQEVI